MKRSELEEKLPEEMRAAVVEIFAGLLNDFKAGWQAELDVLRAERRALAAELQCELVQFKADLLTLRAGL